MDVDADGPYLEPSSACVRMPVPCNDRHRPTVVALQIKRIADDWVTVVRPSTVRWTHGTGGRIAVDDVLDLT